MLAARLAVPRDVPRFLERHRLTDLLDAGVQGPLTVVHGPAGSGKTLLVSAWAASDRPPGPLAWVTLDSDVDGSGSFWSHVLQSLGGCGLAVTDEVGRPARADEVDRALLSRLAAALSEVGEPVVLVLDDYDRVSPGPVDRELDFVLRNSAPFLRLVVVGRRRPQLRLARYRVAGGLQEIGPADLAFTSTEAQALLRRHGVPQPAEVVDDLTDRTEGWATGLRLSALALEHGTPPDELECLLSSAHGDVADFLLAEVVDELPATTQDLLLRTCLLDRVSGDLADAMTGRSNGQRVLEDLARTGSFVRAVAGTTRWYRFHDLFATALRGRLEVREPDLVPQLHRRASRWLAEHDRLTEAVAHAVAADDWELAADEVVDGLAIGHLLVGLETRRLATLFERMPPDHGGTASMAAVQAALAMSRFDVTTCTAALARAADRLPDVPPERRTAVRLALASVRVIVSRLTGDVPGGEAAGAEARNLAAQLPPDRMARHPELLALVLSSLGTLQLWGGSVDAAERTLNDGLAVAVGPPTEYARSNCLGQLAFVHYLRGRLGQAHAAATEALDLATRSGLPPAARVPVGNLAAAALAWEWDDLVAVTAHVEQAAGSVAAQHDPSFAVLVAQYRARCRLARGTPAEALDILGAVHGERSMLPPATFVLAPVAVDEAVALLAVGESARARELLEAMPDGPDRQVGLARLHLAANDWTEALAALGELPDDEALAPGHAVRAQLGAAQALVATGRTRAARRRVEQALERARPERFRRPFTEAGPWWRRALQDDETLLSAHGWLGARLTGVAPAPGVEEPPPLVVEALTEKELEVLRLAAQPMSSREVAETMHLSVNTVKTHLRSVYRKLSASGRNQAVRRARSLGIL